MTQAPLCSIVIPAFNSSRFIVDTLNSVFSQGELPLEVILVDDGSTDNTLHIVKGFSDVKIIAQSNQGDSAARQAGLLEARADFVIFLDHDDILEPDAIKLHFEVFESCEDIDMVFGSNYLINAYGERVGVSLQERRRFSGREIALGTTPSFSQCMYRRSALLKIGGFRSSAGSCADHDLNIRLLGGRPAGICHEGIVMSYRLHQNQQTKSPSRIYLKHREVLEEHLGPGGIIEDPNLLTEASRYWNIYFGQFVPGEILRRLGVRDFSGALAALSVYLSGFPGSCIGTARFVAARFKRS